MLHRLAAAVAAMAASAGGLDALAFTAGIGEGSALVRERLSARLGFLDVDLDIDKNENAKPDCDVAKDGRPSASLSCARAKSWSRRVLREIFSPQTANRLDRPNLACSVDRATSTGRSA